MQRQVKRPRRPLTLVLILILTMGAFCSSEFVGAAGATSAGRLDCYSATLTGNVVDSFVLQIPQQIPRGDFSVFVNGSKNKLYWFNQFHCQHAQGRSAVKPKANSKSIEFACSGDDDGGDFSYSLAGSQMHMSIRHLGFGGVGKEGPHMKIPSGKAMPVNLKKMACK